MSSYEWLSRCLGIEWTRIFDIEGGYKRYVKTGKTSPIITSSDDVVNINQNKSAPNMSSCYIFV